MDSATELETESTAESGGGAQVEATPRTRTPTLMIKASDTQDSSDTQISTARVLTQGSSSGASGTQDSDEATPPPAHTRLTHALCGGDGAARRRQCRLVSEEELELRTPVGRVLHVYILSALFIPVLFALFCFIFFHLRYGAHAAAAHCSVGRVWVNCGQAWGPDDDSCVEEGWTSADGERCYGRGRHNYTAKDEPLPEYAHLGLPIHCFSLQVIPCHEMRSSCIRFASDICWARFGARGEDFAFRDTKDASVFVDAPIFRVLATEPFRPNEALCPNP